MMVVKSKQANRPFLASLLALVACVVTANAITVQSTAALSTTLPIDLSSYTGHTSVLGGAYTLYWKVDTAASMIYLAVDVSTSGWVGFGIADPANGGMRGADIVTLSVTSNATHTVTSLTDRYALLNTLPNEDACNQWNVTAGWQSASRTVAAFQRAFNTNDTQDRVITAGPVKVIVAYSADGTSQVAYHQGNKHAFAVTFFDDASSIVPVSQESVAVLNYTNPPTPIPSKETAYMCTGFSFKPTPPSGNGSVSGQIVEIAPLVDPTTAQYVHHYLVYACQNNAKYQTMFNKPTECLTNDFNIFDICPLLIYAYAPGSGSLTFPANVGLPFGNTTDPFDPTFLAIEIHYNNENPAQTPNISDVSGLSFTYTTTKREHDASIMSLGDPLVLGEFMPFGNPRVERQITCPGECTSKWPWDINVFASFLHMHSYGRATWSTVTSGGVTRDLDRIDFFQFIFQHATSVNTSVKRGDRMNLHCVYDTSVNMFPKLRPNDTGVAFNLASEDEMCLSFVYYWPKFPNLPQYSTCGLYVNGSTTCGEYGPDSLIPIAVANPVNASDPNSDPANSSFIAFGNNGTCNAGSTTLNPSAAGRVEVKIWAAVVAAAFVALIVA